MSIELLKQPGSSSGPVRLRFGLSVDSTGYSSDSTGSVDLADNQWHDVDLRFHERLLQWRLDGADDWNPLANATEVEQSPLFRRAVGDNSIHRQTITLGRGYTGCLLQGPSLRFDSLDNAEDILIGHCPVPLEGDCSKLPVVPGLSEDDLTFDFFALCSKGSGDRNDPCWSRPCLNDGRCRATGTSGFECLCTRRYVGDRCQHDLGSLCDRPENGCLNGGTCLEQVAGNGTTCLCPPNFTGTFSTFRLESS